MNEPMVVTNLRLPKSEWLAVKTSAADYGMSVNEFVNWAIRTVSKARALAFTKPILFKKIDPIWDWPNLNKKIKMRASGGLSVEDKIIYGG